MHSTLFHPGSGKARLTRRQWLASLSAAALAIHSPRLLALPSVPTRLVGTWQDAEGFSLGVIQVPPAADEAIVLEHVLRLPTRAHGLQVLPDGDVLLNARRPGDWLLRWTPGQAKSEARWQWIDDDHRYNGHVLADGNGRLLFTTETRLADGQGVLGVRDSRSLARVATWETGGQDPHMMLQLPVRMGPLAPGTLVVANGGIPTQPETGRVKQHLDQMDPSLVAIDPATGSRLGQWRLADARLSIRHLAFDPVSCQVGIALQAEHDDEARRGASPVLALFDGMRLQSGEQISRLKGYGGDICARPEGGFVVSCPKSHQVALFDSGGELLMAVAQSDVCALVASERGEWWAAGRDQIVSRGVANEPGTVPHPNRVVSAASSATGELALSPRWDNHWRVLPSTSS